MFCTFDNRVRKQFSSTRYDNASITDVISSSPDSAAYRTSIPVVIFGMIATFSREIRSRAAHIPCVKTQPAFRYPSITIKSIPLTFFPINRNVRVREKNIRLRCTALLSRQIRHARTVVFRRSCLRVIADAIFPVDS